MESFDWAGGDHARYVFGDGALAVRLARAGKVAVDIETRGLGVLAYQLTAVSIGTRDLAVVLDPTDPAHRRAIRDALSIAGTLWFHNAPFDVPSLVANRLMPIRAIDHVVDTLVTARLAHPGERVPHGLGATAERYLGAGYAVWKDSLTHGFKAATGRTKAQMFAELGLSSPAFVAYAAFDVIMTARIAAVMPGSVRAYKADPVEIIRREQTVNRMLLRRMARGILVDTDVVDDLKAEMRQEAAAADVVLRGYGVDVELSRPLVKRDAVRVLGELGALPARHPRLKSGEPTADQRYLDKIAHPIVAALKRRSQAERFATDYADTVLDLAGFDGRIRPSVNVMAATTGRQSVGNPALQQFPARVRRMLDFERPVTSLDWASIEPVFAGNAFGDTALLAEFESGGDLYQPVADAAGVTRKAAKTVVLGTLYGLGVDSLAGQLETTPERAAQIRTAVLGRMPGVRDGAARLRRLGDSLGWIATLSGRRIPLDPDPKRAGMGGGYLGYRAPNYYIQGSCLDLLSEVLAEMHRRDLDDALEFAVHDELVVATEVAQEIDEIMRTPPEALVELAGRVPVLRTGRSDLGTHWEEKAA